MGNKFSQFSRPGSAARPQLRGVAPPVDAPVVVGMPVENKPPAVENKPPAVENKPPAVENKPPAVENKPPAVKDTKPEMAMGGAAPQQLDLVFTMDTTGSMGSYIVAAKRNIEAIVSRLVQSEGYDLRFGLVAYRDHPPQDQTYVVKQFPFTDDVAVMQRQLATLSAQGGGDGPEAVEAGLHATLEADWRTNATKVAILIADAPPHGLGERGDGFPNGAPTGVDPLQVLEQMSMRGICIYSVGCEPALGSYQYAKDFFIAAAQKTNGQAVSLSSAAALADVIMGGAIEEMDLEQLAAEVVSEVKARRAARPVDYTAEADGYNSEEERAAAWEVIQHRGHATRHMQTKKLKGRNASLVSKAASLSEVRATLKSVAPARKAAKASTARPMDSSRRAAPAPRGAGASSDGLAFCSDVSLSTVSFASAEASNFDAEFRGDKAAGAPAMLARRCSLSGSESDSGSDGDWSDGAGSDSDGEGPGGGGGGGGAGGVKLETRALSFSQMSRIYGRQKKMGVL